MSLLVNRRLWARPWDLRDRGVLGINRRNLQFLFELNPRCKYKLVDDKVLTKQVCDRHGISVPETYGVIERFGDLQRLEGIVKHLKQFVAKPASGSGGRGVLVVVGRDGEDFVCAKGEQVSFSELRYHMSTTLSGLYSLGGQSDRVIIEERIVPHPAFEGLSVGGTPDIRIIVYRGCPALAMLRLATEASKGRANLHQGAIAAGINLETGRTRGGVWHDRVVNVHPDSGLSIAGLEIPEWGRMLATARGLAEALEMGYVGVDIALDVVKGPVVLEANARPGLAVQIANGVGLATVLAEIDRLSLLERRLPCLAWRHSYAHTCSNNKEVCPCR